MRWRVCAKNLQYHPGELRRNKAKLAVSNSYGESDPEPTDVDLEHMHYKTTR